MATSLVIVMTAFVSAFLLSLYPWKLSTDTGDMWTVRSADGDIETKAQVPGSVHMALFKAGIIIEDPYYRYNDVKLRWVQNKTWIFEKLFIVKTKPENQTAMLVFEGIDTVASIQFNKILIANVANQFLRYRFDVTDIIKEGLNNITVVIAPAVAYGAQRFKEIKKKLGYDVPPACPPPEQNPECHANMVRKEQAAFGWDWGPAFVTQGIWKGINLLYYPECDFLDLVAQPLSGDSKPREGIWHLNVTTYIECRQAPSTKARLEMQLLGSNIVRIKNIDLKPNDNVINHIIQDIQVDMWWPRGYGNHTLYTLEVTLVTEKTRTKKTLRVGFRTVTLEQPQMNNGLGFHFNINGRPIFMKGSNWIPADSFQDRVDKVRIKQLLQSAVDANMNTIRVWGGGIYEQDYFYDLADEYGLMVWQDFMFACAMYPTTEDFLTSVREEVKYQLKRLVSHPSIISWSGNNENEGALVDNWFGTTGSNFNNYLQDYKTLYKGVIEEEVRSMTQVPFLLSSPSNGKITEQQGGVSQHPEPGSPYYGDVHYYNYLDDCLNLSIYPKTRFASEYGWQSWPSYSSLTNVSLPDDLKYKSRFFVHREHRKAAGDGTDQLIHRHFHWPNNTKTEKGFRHYIYLTQVMQAVCYRAETEFYRRGRSDPNVNTMGALYWQLNEIWQAPSWSTLEYDGKWKMAHHAARYFFSDVLLSTYLEKGVIMGYVINDGQKDLRGYVIDLQVHDWERVFWTSRIYHHPKILRAGTVTKVFEYTLSELCEYAGLCNPADGFVVFQLWQPWTDLSILDCIQFLVPFKQVKALRDPQITIRSIDVKDSHTLTIHLHGRCVAPFTWLDAGHIKGRFSENGFTYYTTTNYYRDIDFYTWQDGVTPELLNNSLTITSLWDTYN